MPYQSGVQRYTVGTVTVSNGFPNDEMRCKWCRFCHTDDSMRKRERCIITEELLYDINFIGTRCPMTFTKEANHGQSGDL